MEVMWGVGCGAVVGEDGGVIMVSMVLCAWVTHEAGTVGVRHSAGSGRDKRWQGRSCCKASQTSLKSTRPFNTLWKLLFNLNIASRLVTAK